MSEEIIEESIQPVSKIPEFKKVCMKLGLMMIVIFVSRGICSIIVSLLQPSLEQMNDATLKYLVETLFSFLFLYVIPIVVTCIVMKMPSGGMCGRVYGKPKYFGQAMGMFPAFYGVSIMVNMLTILVSTLFTNMDFNKSFNTVNELQPDNMACAVILFIQLVVVAPVLEEFWFRGIVMESLRPYGNGFAIFVSALLFGMTHANFQQFFYATVLGICLGYIAVSTRSIVTTMIMHAMFNGVSGVLFIFLTTQSVQDYMTDVSRGVNAEMDATVVAYLVFMFIVIMLMIIGVIMSFWKIKKIKKYKVPKMWTELSTPKRWGIFFSRPTVIVMLILAVDTFVFGFVPSFVYKIIAG